MYEKSLKPTWTTDDIKKAVERALKALKGSDASLSIMNVATRAASYRVASAPIIERYLKSLSDEARCELGFPDPRAQPTPTGTRIGPDLGSAVRCRPPAPRVGRRI